MEKVKLEAGMIIYACSRFNGLGRLKIARTTPKRAFTENGTCFEREVDPTFFHARGDNSSFRSTRYCLETDELNKQYHRKMLLLAFGEIKTVELSDEQLEEIIKIANKNEATNADD